MMKQKGLQLACKLVRYGFTKNHIFPMKFKVYTDKLPAAATVHFSGAQSVTAVKGLTCSNYKCEHEHSICS